MFDALQIVSWQLGGGKKSNKPKPLPRPGIAGPTRHGSTTRKPAEVIAYLRRFGPRPKAGDDG